MHGQHDQHGHHTAYRAVLLAAALVLLGILFQQLLTLLMIILATIIVAIPISSIATRLERWNVPRPLGALLALFGILALIAGFFYLFIPPLIAQTRAFIRQIPEIAGQLQQGIHNLTGLGRGEIGGKGQKFIDQYTDHPELVLGPAASLGLGLMGAAFTLVLMLITAYYMAASPQPLVEGLLRLAHPSRREQLGVALERAKNMWIGWIQGVGIDMIVSGVLLFAGLTIIGLKYALVFAVLSALLVVVPYFGAIVGAVPPTLFALTYSPGKALLVFLIYVLVQQVESNLIVPMVMSKAVKLHPALIATGVVVVGQLFGLMGLFVAVPLISLAVILADEFWIKPMEGEERHIFAPPLNEHGKKRDPAQGKNDQEQDPPGRPAGDGD